MFATILNSLLLLLISMVTCVMADENFSSAVSLQGRFTQGGLIIGQLQLPARSITLDKKPVYFDKDGHFVFGFDRDCPAQRTLKIELADGKVLERILDVEARTYDVQKIDGLPQHQVTPDKKVLSRIREEAVAITQARKRLDDRLDFRAPFEWPVIGPISGVYGSQRVLNGSPRRPHYGVDVAAPVGTPVKAPAPGIITFVHKDMYFSGGTVVLDHGHGLSSSFLHLSAIYVETGDVVQRGDIIAAVGATGRVTGAHLDWRMNWQNEHIDPALLVKPMESILGQNN